MDGVMSQRSAALVHLMWPLPCRQSTYVDTHSLARVHIYIHTHTQECMTVNHGCDVCVSGLRMKKRAKEHQGMLCIQQIERQRKRAGERGRGAWHCSSLSDGSSSGLRRGLPLISLSLDMKKKERGGEEGG